ncbi:hypothetical protein [Deinococcus peraridilitoris]|uniref:Uncharacterized protein n=1 Tax=Deinococcus peraridilitoris (strain DSM 19664 / LMG 22246 / CIP 109416 / KR-200) TaxID=937777 RepID=L0A689_DEIPD|nr:hypothetical protein [Deinococcus peraridilitoris]AFZ68535.1 hypothetical protein Deipe_3087 [Deinococcus peraridilitoris DSM 19664]
MLRLHKTLDEVIAFLVPEGTALPRVMLASTRDALNGADVRELTPDEWPLVTVRGLHGRALDQVTVVFDPVESPLPLPERGEMMVVMLRWRAPRIAADTRAGGEHHIMRRERKAASKFEQRLRELRKKP